MKAAFLFARKWNRDDVNSNLIKFVHYSLSYRIYSVTC